MIGKNFPLSHLQSRKKTTYLRKWQSYIFTKWITIMFISVFIVPFRWAFLECCYWSLKKRLSCFNNKKYFTNDHLPDFFHSSNLELIFKFKLQIYFTILKVQITEATSKTTRENMKSQTSYGKSAAHQVFWQLLQTFENISCWNLKLLLVKHLGFFNN